MLICEKCEIGADQVDVKFAFTVGMYLCRSCNPLWHRGHSSGGVVIRRRLGINSISQARENFLADHTLSPEDGETIISRSSGRQVEDNG